MHLPKDKSKWARSNKTQIDSISGAPADEELNRRNTSVEIIIALIVITMLICCVCGYFILKNRGSCFRKLSEAERGQNPGDDSRRGTAIEVGEISASVEMEESNDAARV